MDIFRKLPGAARLALARTLILSSITLAIRQPSNDFKLLWELFLRSWRTHDVVLRRISPFPTACARLLARYVAEAQRCRIQLRFDIHSLGRC